VRIKWRNGIWIASIQKSGIKLRWANNSPNNTPNPRHGGRLTKTTETQYTMDSDDKFEWDHNKAASNRAKHGISFDEAKGVFRDTYAIEELDNQEDYGEVRYILIGMTEGKLLFVVYTERGEKIRLISARKADKDEQNEYYLQNATEWEGVE